MRRFFPSKVSTLRLKNHWTEQFTVPMRQSWAWWVLGGGHSPEWLSLQGGVCVVLRGGEGWWCLGWEMPVLWKLQRKLTLQGASLSPRVIKRKEGAKKKWKNGNTSGRAVWSQLEEMGGRLSDECAISPEGGRTLKVTLCKGKNKNQKPNPTTTNNVAKENTHTQTHTHACTQAFEFLEMSD